MFVVVAPEEHDRSALAIIGHRRSFALLRPIVDSSAQDRVRDLILQAYMEHEEQAAVAE